MKTKHKSKNIRTLIFEGEEYEPSHISPVTSKVPRVEYKLAPKSDVITKTNKDESEPQPLSEFSQKSDSLPEYKPHSKNLLYQNINQGQLKRLKVVWIVDQ